MNAETTRTEEARREGSGAPKRAAKAAGKNKSAASTKGRGNKGATKSAASRGKGPAKRSLSARAKKLIGTVADDLRSAKASVRHVRMTPRRARLVINMIRGKQVEQAMNILRFSPQKGAKIALKLLQSAVANAREHKALDVDRLWITQAFVDMGRTMVRHMPGAQGRANPVKKRSSHFTVVLSER